MKKSKYRLWLLTKRKEKWGAKKRSPQGEPIDSVSAQDGRWMFSITIIIIRSKLLNERIYVLILDDRKNSSERGRIGASSETMVEEVLTIGVMREDWSKNRGLNGNCGASRMLELCEQVRLCHGKRWRRRWRRVVFHLHLQLQLLL